MQPIPSQINLKSRRRKSKQRDRRREQKINKIAFSAFSNFGSCNLAPGAKGSKVLDLQSNKLFCAASMLFGGPRNFSAIKLKWHFSTTISGMNNKASCFPSLEKQILIFCQWSQVLQTPLQRGMPYFRLGCLHF